MGKRNIIVSLVEAETNCIFDELYQDNGFKTIACELIRTESVEDIAGALIEYARRNLI